VKSITTSEIQIINHKQRSAYKYIQIENNQPLLEINAKLLIHFAVKVFIGPFSAAEFQ